MDDSAIWPDATKWAEQPETVLDDLRELGERIQKRLTSNFVFIGDETDLSTLASESNLFFRRLQAANAVTPIPVNRERLQSVVESAIAHVIGESQARSSMAFVLALSAIDTEYNAASEWVRLKQHKAKKMDDHQSNNPWKQARDADSKVTIADQMLLLFKRDDSIVDRKNLSGEVAKILDCSSQAVRHKDNASWIYYQAERDRRKEVRQALKGKHSSQFRNGKMLAKSDDEDADD